MALLLPLLGGFDGGPEGLDGALRRVQLGICGIEVLHCRLGFIGCGNTSAIGGPQRCLQARDFLLDHPVGLDPRCRAALRIAQHLRDRPDERR